MHDLNGSLVDIEDLISKDDEPVKFFIHDQDSKRRTLLSPETSFPKVSSVLDTIPALYLESIGLLFWDPDELWTYPVFLMSIFYCMLLWPIRVYFLMTGGENNTKYSFVEAVEILGTGFEKAFRKVFYLNFDIAVNVVFLLPIELMVWVIQFSRWFPYLLFIQLDYWLSRIDYYTG